MSTTRAVVVAVALLVSAGCGSSGAAGTASSSSPTPTSSASASAAVSLSCDEVEQEASHLTTYLHYVDLNIGTTNDSTPYFDEIDGVIATLREAIEPCFPTDAAEVAGLGRTTDALRQSWVTGADQSAKDTDTALLADVRAQGEPLWIALGWVSAGWEQLPAVSG
jgi:hypothetical protein